MADDTTPDEEDDMDPAHDRRQRAPQTSDTPGWHSLEFVIRQALEVQRDIGTPGAEAFLQGIGINQQVINRVLAPDARLRAADQLALENPVVVAELPITPRNSSWRRHMK
jgi:hypothetical protein